MRKIVFIFLISLILFTFQTFTGCSKANSSQKLTVEKVDIPENGKGNENDKEKDPENEEGDLFSGEPGTIVKMSALAGIDPVGTSVVDDFDGDGIRNEDEITTNAWVANYPRIEVYIAPPVTLKIEIQDETETKTKVLQSEITSSDVEFKSDHSTDAVHNNEINLRTVQYQDSYNKSQEASHEEESSSSKNESATYSGEVSVFEFGGAKASYSSSSGSSKSNKVANAHSDTYGETKTKWKDKPFKNNTERNGWSVKSNNAAKNARNLRKDIRTSFNGSSTVKANAGYVRASLYIKNETVNMPVKLSNILCSLMFETPQGQLIPVQSFRLRNDDYSMFEIEVYGDDTFGPYVVELKNLNTHEVKEAIEKGYNPKIFIVNYDMTHVEDSNYKVKLSDKFTGDNLKIIEENVKGRTAGVRIIGPNIRDFYRITAFEAMLGDNVVAENQLGVDEADAMRPGTSLKKALERLSYSGMNVEFANYIVDFSGMVPEMKIEGSTKAMFMLTAIKSINGIKTKIPLVEFKDENGNVIEHSIEYEGKKVYITKPASQWTEKEAKSFKAWSVMSDSKFFGYTNDVMEAGNTKSFTFTDETGTEQTIPVVEGMNSTIWPGDHYDIVYINMEDYYKMLASFGNTPLDTQKKLKFNTKWKKSDLGEHPFYPDTNSRYLGQVSLGDTIQFKIKLNWTRYLNPSFGEMKEVNHTAYYSDFSYDMTRAKSDKKFLLGEAIDFELSFASGGKYEHWLNLKPKRMPNSIFNDYYYTTNDENYKNIMYLWDFMNQEFIVKLKIPTASDVEGVDADVDGSGGQEPLFDGRIFPGISDDGLISVYLRTGLNTAYRESIWPLKDVKKFRGFLYRVQTGVSDNGNIIYDTKNITVSNYIGSIEIGDKILFYANDEVCTINEIEANDNEGFNIACNENLSSDIKGGEHVYVEYRENYDKLKPEISVKEGRSLSNTNTYCINTWYEDSSKFKTFLDYFIPCTSSGYSNNNKLFMGYNNEGIVYNWIGSNNLNNPNWNNWSDSSNYNEFLSKNFKPFLEGKEWPEINVDISLNQDEFNINEQVNEIQYKMSKPYNSKSLIVWEENNNIIAQVYNLETGKKVGLEISINLGGANVSNFNPQVSVSDNKAVIVWGQIDDSPLVAFKYKLKGQVIDINTGEKIGENFIVDQGHQEEFNPFKVVADGDIAFVLYKNITKLKGQLIDLSASSATGYSTTIVDNYFLSPDVSISGNNIWVVWNYTGISQQSSIKGRQLHIVNNGDMLDLATNPNTFNISESEHLNARQKEPKVLSYENKLIFVWESYDGTGGFEGNNKIKGRVADISGTGFYTNTFDISKEDGTHPILSISNTGKVFVMWKDRFYDNGLYFSKNIKGQIFDANNINLMSNEINIINNTKNYGISVSGDKAFIVSTIKDDEVYGDGYSEDNYIIGQEINITTGEKIGNQVYIGETKAGNSGDVSVSAPEVSQPLVALEGDNALAIWKTNENNTNIIKGRVIDLHSTFEHIEDGLNYFFKAPLIEREYDVEVKILK